MLEEQFQDEESTYAAEGTAGHAMAEHLIKKYLNSAPAALCPTIIRTSCWRP